MALSPGFARAVADALLFAWAATGELVRGVVYDWSAVVLVAGAIAIAVLGLAVLARQ